MLNGLPGRAAIILFAFCLITLWPATAHADWRRAESDRFIVYSDGSERDLRAYVQQLEAFDRVLRLVMRLPPDEHPPRKLPIYLVRDHIAALRQVNPSTSETVGGFYMAGEQDIFAVARRSRGDDLIVLHEYGHHFMHQHFTLPFPAWYVEGFAEYYATTEILTDRVNIGQFHEDRAYWLMSSDWMPIEDLLRGAGPSISGGYPETYYPLSWLLTHWFLSSPERQAMMNAYLSGTIRGGDPVEVLDEALGMTPQDLERALRDYSRSRLMYRRLDIAFPAFDIEVQQLPESADSLLLIDQRLKLERDLDDRLLEQVRSLAARHPGDPFARRVLARAEILQGDPAAGRAILERLLEDSPEDVEALQLSADALIRYSAEAPQGAEAARAEAQGYLQRAYQADDANFRTFLMIAENRAGASDYPNEHDLAAWELAYTLAPQLQQARFGYAQALMVHDRNDEAITVLRPLLYDPHNPEMAGYVRQLIQRARGETVLFIPVVPEEAAPDDAAAEDQTEETLSES